MSSVEKFIGESQLKSTPTKKFTFIIDDKKVTTAKIADNAITEEKISGEDTPEGAAVTTSKIKDGAVTNPKIANGAVTTIKIQDFDAESSFPTGVTNEKLADESVTESKLASGAVTEGKIAPNAVTAGKIADGAVIEGNIAAGAVTHDNLTEACVQAGNIANGAVQSGNLAPNAVQEGNIAPGAIHTEDIHDGAVTTAKIEDYDPNSETPTGVTTAKIADEAITEDKLAPQAVTTDKLADGLISEIENITDAVPTAGSVKPVQSGGVAEEIYIPSIIGIKKTELENGGIWQGSNAPSTKDIRLIGYIPVPENVNKIIVYNNSDDSDTTWWRLKVPFYNESKQYIATQYGTNYFYSKAKEFQVPENAKYVRVCCSLYDGTSSLGTTVNDYTDGIVSFEIGYSTVKEEIVTIKNEAVKISVQELSESEKSIARNNIDAASKEVESKVSFKMDSAETKWDWQVGYINGQGIIETGSGAPAGYRYTNEFIPVIPGAKYKITAKSDIGVSPINYYDANKKFISHLSYVDYHGEVLTMPENCYFVRICYIKWQRPNDDIVVFEYVDSIYSNLSNIALNNVMGDDFDILQCPDVYTRKNEYGSGKQLYTDVIYPEGFVTSKNDVYSINGGRQFQSRSAGNVSSTTVRICNGKSEKAVSIPIKTVSPSAAQNKKIFVLSIGESTTALDVDNPYTKTTEVCHGWPSSLQYFANIDNIDYGNISIKTIGTGHNTSEANMEYSYKGVTYNDFRSCREGHSGWNTYTMINYPYPLSISLGATLWHLLGLYTKTPYGGSTPSGTEDYIGTDAQNLLMELTPFGKYKVDCNEAVWNWIISVAGNNDYPSFSGSGSYTGSESQKTLITNWIEQICANPKNPFYSVDEARTGESNTAFSLAKYLERYRTMDDVGGRLTGSAGQSVIGSDGETYTIGTRVTNTSAFDVCTPTHIIINMGINDTGAPNIPANSVEVVKHFVGLFDVPVGYFVCRIPGVCEPSKWSVDAIAPKLPSEIYSFEYNVLNALTPWFVEQQGKYLIPAYHIQHPASVFQEFTEGTFDADDRKILNTSVINIHAGYSAFKSIGWQCLNWIYYTLSLS